MSDLWEGRSKHQELFPRVFITNFFGAKNKKKLLSIGITHIVNCTNELPCPFESTIEYLRIPVADNTHVQINSHFEEIVTWIDKALESNENNKILIHCAAGSSRSGTVILAYILSKQYETKTLEEIYEEAKKHRPIIQPNPGFYEQLVEYDNKIRNK